MYFDLRKSPIYEAVVFYRLFPIGLLKFYKAVFFSFGFLASAYGFYFTADLFLGLALIFIPLGFSVLFFELFGRNYLRYTPARDRDNLADLLDYNCARILDKAMAVSWRLGEKKVSIKSLMIAILGDDYVEGVLARIIPGFGKVRAEIKSIADTKVPKGFGYFYHNPIISEELIKLLADAAKVKDKHRSDKVSILDILAMLFDYDREFRQFTIDQDLDKEDLEELAYWHEQIWSYLENARKFWRLENLLRKPPIGRSWIYGYSPYLSAFAVNLSDELESSLPVLKLVGRKKEIEEMEQILSRSGKNNILIVGEEGVGRSRLLADFVGLIARGQALPGLNYKKVFDLNIPLIASSAKDALDIQNILVNIFNEAVKAGNIILVMRDIHNFVGELGGLGRIDISEILAPYLKSARIQFIATTNPPSFHKFIENRSEIAGNFERLDLEEFDKFQTLRTLEEMVPLIENKSRTFILYSAIKSIVDGADKFIRTAPFPEKAIDLLAEVVSYGASRKIRIITAQEVNEVISRKTGIKLGPIVIEEKERLSNLEKLMHKQLVGQDRAVEVVASALRRLRTGLAKKGKPAGAFLFVGPTGVGKTLTAKILAETYFGSQDRMIRFDMSEYQDIESLDRFLGNLRANEPGRFVSAVRDNPFSLILLDEIEKANKNILNIFLQVFDEGRLTDVFGRKVSFEQNIIIATSNAGANYIREMVKEGLDPSMEKEKVIDILIREKYFSPEFLNRFDEIVIFHPLSLEQIADIAKILVKALVERLSGQGYLFKPALEIIDYVSKIGFDPQFGARPMQRVIKDKIENAIARKILNGEIRKGEEFTLSLDDVK